MQVTLCDTACGNKVIGSGGKVTCRITVGEIKFRVSIEVTKPKQKFYRRLDLCTKCLMMLELQLEHILSSFFVLEDPATCMSDLPDSWIESDKNACDPCNFNSFNAYFEEVEAGNIEA